MCGRNAADPIRVARVITRLNIGGPAIHAILLHHELAARGYAPLLITGECEEGEGSMAYLLAPEDAVCRVAHLSRSVSPLRNLRAVVRLWRILRRERPDIVHTHTAMAGCVGRAAAILARVPVVVHTFHGNSLRHYFSPAVSAVFLWIERLLARRTDVICVLSRQQMEELSGAFRVAPRSRFRIVPLGLELQPFLQMAPPPVRQPLRVGWFGRLVDVKNIQLLLDTVEALRADCRFEFHITGDGPERGRVEAALPRLGPRLVWHGWQHDIAPVLAACHLVIQTSRNEGTPVALIQAMAAGRPFLATPVGGIVDMTCGIAGGLTPDAAWFDNAVLVAPRPGAFAAALGRFADVPSQLLEMGRSARVVAAARYRKEELVSNLDSLYRELVERRWPGRARTRDAVLEQV